MYINTFSLTGFAERGVKRPSSSVTLHTEDYKLQEILISPSAEESEDEKEAHVSSYRRFSSRGIQKVRFSAA